MKDIITHKHIGTRLLIGSRFTNIGRDEVEVLEISPSRENVKLRNCIAGNEYWSPVDEHRVIEVLSSANAQAQTRKPQALT